jgi:hypothetical protein
MKPITNYAVTALAILFYALTIASAWCAFFDTTPPIDILSGRVVSFDRNSHVALVEWEALKHRYCPGIRAGWLRDGVVVALPEVVLPPENFRGTISPVGSVIRWTVPIDVPPYLADDFVYKAEWQFSCNFMQSIFPLRVQSPFVAVKQ